MPAATTEVNARDRILRLERAMLTSWPALSAAFDGDWVIRLADGMTKRSNSVTCLGADDADLDPRIDHAAGIYRERGLPAIFRLSPLASPALDARLDQRGWRRFDETMVMTADLDAIQATTAHVPDLEVDIAARPDHRWIESCFRLDGADGGDLDLLETMLQRLVPPAGYGRIDGDDRIDALGLIVVDRELAGLFEVLTVEERRRQGLSRALVRNLFAWSREKGARAGWLAVVADNLPAVRLYRSLGFHEIYRYHYRSDG